MAQFPARYPKIPRSTDPCVLRSGDMAVGVWNLNKRADIVANQVLEKSQAALFDEICHWGIDTLLWQEQRPQGLQDPLDLRPGVGVCSCVTDTALQPDTKCLTCHGTSTLGGFEQWGYRYIHVASVSPQVALLTNCHVDTKIKPNRILLDPGKPSGTFETTDFPINNPDNYPFEFRLNAFIRDGIRRHRHLP